MKKAMTIMLGLVVALVLVACDGDDANGGGNGDLGPIGFSVSTLNNPFFVSMEEGARAMADELGVELIVVDANNDAAKQVTDIEDLMSRGIEVLIISAVDSAAAGPIVQDVIDAGIYVIAVGRVVDGVEVDTFIGTDNVTAAQEAAEFFINEIGEGARVAVLEGVPGASSAITRLEGFMLAADGRLEIVSSLTANFDRAEGLAVAESILQAHPDIEGIFAMNDEMGLGAIEAAIAAGRTPGVDILITGFDANDDARAAVEAGTMLLTAEQNTVLMGATSVEKAVDFINGVTVPVNIPIDVELIY